MKRGKLWMTVAVLSMVGRLAWAAEADQPKAEPKAPKPQTREARPAGQTEFLQGRLKDLEATLERLDSQYGQLTSPEAVKQLEELKGAYAAAIKEIKTEMEQGGKDQLSNFWMKYSTITRRTSSMQKILGLYKQKEDFQRLLDQAQAEDPRTGPAKEAVVLCDKLIASERQIARLADEQDELQRQLFEVRRKMWETPRPRPKPERKPDEGSDVQF